MGGRYPRPGFSSLPAVCAPRYDAAVHTHRGTAVGAATLAFAVALASLGLGALAPPAPADANPTPAPTASGPAPGYRCTFDVGTDAFTGANGTAAAIGWLGDHNSVITCLGGTFVVQDGPGDLFQQYGFGIYEGQRTTWADAGGFLPAQVTTFGDLGATVSITEFADRVVLGGVPFVVVYSRVRIDNPTGHAVFAGPSPSPALVPIDAAPAVVPAHQIVHHDYAVVADQFGGTAPWPSAQTLAAAGGFDEHYAHMRAFWTRQLAAIAQIHVPDPTLVNAYKSGFITTQITRSGNNLDTGVNGYEMEFSHDVIGILTNLFTQGYFTGAHALLTEARSAIGPQGQYVDGLWSYPVPWAVYLMKTGDKAFVAQNFATEGPQGAATQPSIEDSAHAIAAARTGPMGTMEATNDIDTQGYWTTDDYEALLGLAAYRYLASALGNTTEAAWASTEYNSLLTAVNTVLGQTISANRLDYLPCSLVQPNTANRCDNPKDANWTSPFGFGSWAWEGYLLGAPVSGPGLSMIDATYAYGFGRLHGILPPGTAGGFPGDYYSSGYNAAMGLAGLASTAHRVQGIVGYQFMIANSQSGPLSWWESSSAPDPSSPWVGRHPATGQGSSPHAWGLAGANKVLLDSLVAQSANGQARGGPGHPSGLVAARDVDLGGQLPHHRGPACQHCHRLFGRIGHPHNGRRRAGGFGPVRTPLLHPKRGVDHQGHRGPGDRNGHGARFGPPRHRDSAPRPAMLVSGSRRRSAVEQTNVRDRHPARLLGRRPRQAAHPGATGGRVRRARIGQGDHGDGRGDDGGPPERDGVLSPVAEGDADECEDGTPFEARPARPHRQQEADGDHGEEVEAEQLALERNADRERQGHDEHHRLQVVPLAAGQPPEGHRGDRHHQPKGATAVHPVAEIARHMAEGRARFVPRQERLIDDLVQRACPVGQQLGQDDDDAGQSEATGDARQRPPAEASDDGRDGQERQRLERHRQTEQPPGARQAGRPVALDGQCGPQDERQRHTVLGVAPEHHRARHADARHHGEGEPAGIGEAPVTGDRIEREEDARRQDGRDRRQAEPEPEVPVVDLGGGAQPQPVPEGHERSQHELESRRRVDL